MAMLKVVFNNTTKVARVMNATGATPVGSVAVGTFSHPDAVYPDSVVIYHGVRDLLYKRSAANPSQTADYPKNILNMQEISINTVPVTGVSTTPATASIAVAATQQLTTAIAPTDATLVSVSYSSSNPTVATVSTSGLVTGVSTGTATITVTSDDGGYVDTVAVTVTA